MNDENVVMFPGGNRSVPLTLDEVRENLEAVWRVHVDDAMETMCNVVMFNLSLMGFNFDDEKYEKDLGFLAEAVRSLLFKHYNFEHRFQKLAEESFVTDESGTRFMEDENDKRPDLVQPSTAEGDGV